METITLNNFWPRRTVENWTIKPDPELHLAEALMLRDFPVLVKARDARLVHALVKSVSKDSDSEIFGVVSNFHRMFLASELVDFQI